MRNKLSLILLMWLCVFVPDVQSSFAYVPYEELVKEAELIVTGVIIDKQYVKKESMMNRYERSPITDEMVVVESTKYMAQFTDYQLKIEELIKGEVDNEVISIEAIGGCDETGMCMNMSSGYSYELGNRVLIFLKKRPDRDFYQSTVGGLTAYLVTDDGRMYKYQEELEVVGGSSFEEREKPGPKTLKQLKTIVAEQHEES